MADSTLSQESDLTIKMGRQSGDHIEAMFALLNENISKAMRPDPEALEISITPQGKLLKLSRELTCLSKSISVLQNQSITRESTHLSEIVISLQDQSIELSKACLDLIKDSMDRSNQAVYASGVTALGKHIADTFSEHGNQNASLESTRSENQGKNQLAKHGLDDQDDPVQSTKRLKLTSGSEHGNAETMSAGTIGITKMSAESGDQARSDLATTALGTSITDTKCDYSPTEPTNESNIGDKSDNDNLTRPAASKSASTSTALSLVEKDFLEWEAVDIDHDVPEYFRKLGHVLYEINQKVAQDISKLRWDILAENCASDHELDSVDMLHQIMRLFRTVSYRSEIMCFYFRIFAMSKHHWNPASTAQDLQPFQFFYRNAEAPYRSTVLRYLRDWA